MCSHRGQSAYLLVCAGSSGTALLAPNTCHHRKCEDCGLSPPPGESHGKKYHWEGPDVHRLPLLQPVPGQRDSIVRWKECSPGTSELCSPSVVSDFATSMDCSPLRLLHGLPSKNWSGFSCEAWVKPQPLYLAWPDSQIFLTPLAFVSSSAA